MTDRLRRAREWAATGLFIIAISPVLVLPYAWALGLLGAVGRFALPLTPFSRRIARNLGHVGLDLDPRRVAAAVGDCFGRALAEYIRMATMARRSDLRPATGLDHLRAAVATKRGVVIVSAHYGSWEAIRLAARDAGVEVGLIYRRFNNRAFDAVALSRIRLAGEPVIWKGREGRREMLRLLRGGGAILILLDQRLGGGDAQDFLGRPARTATAVAALAHKTGAVLLPAVGRRLSDGVTVDVTFEPPIAAATPGAAMAALNARYAAWIEADPGQWFWLHRRWKGFGG